MRVLCLSCGAESYLYLQTKDYNRRVTTEIFAYQRCPSCGLIFLHPVPKDLGSYYPDDYYSIPSTIEQVAPAAEFERYKIDIVKLFANSGRLLEIGPAYGTFLYLAKQAGFEAEAIEMDPDCCKFLEKVVGVRTMQTNDPSRVLLGDAKYNVIVMWHVIEHLPNLWNALTSIADSLLPGGILVVAAPNPNSFQFKLLGRHWPHIDAPRHLELIPLFVLSEQMKRRGLETLWTTTSDKGTLGWNVFGWQFFLINLFRTGNRYLARALRLAGKIIGKFFSPIERRDGLGSAYTVVFKKGQG